MYDALRNRKSEADAGNALCRSSDSPEGFENVWELFFGNAHSLIRDAELNVTRALLQIKLFSTCSMRYGSQRTGTGKSGTCKTNRCAVEVELNNSKASCATFRASHSMSCNSSCPPSILERSRRSPTMWSSCATCR